MKSLTIILLLLSVSVAWEQEPNLPQFTTEEFTRLIYFSDTLLMRFTSRYYPIVVDSTKPYLPDCEKRRKK